MMAQEAAAGAAKVAMRTMPDAATRRALFPCVVDGAWQGDRSPGVHVRDPRLLEKIGYVEPADWAATSRAAERISEAREVWEEGAWSVVPPREWPVIRGVFCDYAVDRSGEVRVMPRVPRFESERTNAQVAARAMLFRLGTDPERTRSVHVMDPDIRLKIGEVEGPEYIAMYDRYADREDMAMRMQRLWQENPVWVIGAGAIYGLNSNRYFVRPTGEVVFSVNHVRNLRSCDDVAVARRVGFRLSSET